MKTREILILLTMYFLLLTAFFVTAIIIEPNIYLIKIAMVTTSIAIIIACVSMKY